MCNCKSSTDKEQLKCGVCGSLLPDSTCGSMWCPLEDKSKATLLQEWYENKPIL